MTTAYEPEHTATGRSSPRQRAIASRAPGMGRPER